MIEQKVFWLSFSENKIKERRRSLTDEKLQRIALVYYLILTKNNLCCVVVVVVVDVVQRNSIQDFPEVFLIVQAKW